MIIPICMKPMEDEFLYGWLLRIADANGFSFYPDPVYSFTYFYFYKGEVEIKKEGKSVLDQIFNLDEIEKRYANIKCFPSVEFIVNNMTVFGTFMPFISKEEQAQRAMVMFRERTGSVLDTKSLNRMVETLHVCPECMKDDSERCGEPYYHTWHQLPAVKMCPVHGRSLMKVKGPRKGILNGVELPELEKETLQFPVEFELKIARFMYDAYRGQKYGNIENVIDAVRRKMIDLGYSLKEYEKLAEDMTITGVSIGVDTGKWIKRFFKNKPISLKEKILFFTYIFENYAEFERYNRLEESSGREYRAQIEKNYDIISSSENILKVRCRSCGYVFHTLSYAVMCGFGCPECEKQLSAEQCLQKHLQCLGDGNYTLAGELHGSSVKIRHETCGYTISKRLRIIMYGQGVCRCERKLKEEELKKRVDGGLQRFELVSYKKRGNSYDVVIRDRICGKTFPADVNAFANNRYCRACDKSMPDKIRYSKKRCRIVNGSEEGWNFWQAMNMF